MNEEKIQENIEKKCDLIINFIQEDFLQLEKDPCELIEWRVALELVSDCFQNKIDEIRKEIEEIKSQFDRES